MFRAITNIGDAALPLSGVLRPYLLKPQELQLTNCYLKKIKFLQYQFCSPSTSASRACLHTHTGTPRVVLPGQSTALKVLRYFSSFSNVTLEGNNEASLKIFGNDSEKPSSGRHSDASLAASRAWSGLLRELERHGYLFESFPDKLMSLHTPSSPKKHWSLSVEDEALLRFARQRPELIFALPRDKLKALAAAAASSGAATPVPLFAGLPLRNRKDALALARLRDTYLGDGAAAADAYVSYRLHRDFRPRLDVSDADALAGDGDAGVAVKVPDADVRRHFGVVPLASLQDVLRLAKLAVGGDQPAATDPALLAAFADVLDSVTCEIPKPRPALGLGFGGLVEEDTGAASGDHHHGDHGAAAATLRLRLPLLGTAFGEATNVHQRRLERESSRQTKVQSYLDQRHSKRLRDALANGAELAAGDWFCSACGRMNFAGRGRCGGCKNPDSTPGNSVVTAEEVRAIYGKRKPPSRQRTPKGADDDLYLAQLDRIKARAQQAAHQEAAVGFATDSLRKSEIDAAASATGSTRHPSHSPSSSAADVWAAAAAATATATRPPEHLTATAAAAAHASTREAYEEFEEFDDDDSDPLVAAEKFRRQSEQQTHKMAVKLEPAAVPVIAAGSGSESGFESSHATAAVGDDDEAFLKHLNVVKGESLYPFAGHAVPHEMLYGSEAEASVSRFVHVRTYGNDVMTDPLASSREEELELLARRSGRLADLDEEPGTLLGEGDEGDEAGNSDEHVDGTLTDAGRAKHHANFYDDDYSKAGYWQTNLQAKLEQIETAVVKAEAEAEEAAAAAGIGQSEKRRRAEAIAALTNVPKTAAAAAVAAAVTARAARIDLAGAETITVDNSASPSEEGASAVERAAPPPKPGSASLSALRAARKKQKQEAAKQESEATLAAISAVSTPPSQDDNSPGIYASAWSGTSELGSSGRRGFESGFNVSQPVDHEVAQKSFETSMERFLSAGPSSRAAISSKSNYPGSKPQASSSSAFRFSRPTASPDFRRKSFGELEDSGPRSRKASGRGALREELSKEDDEADFGSRRRGGRLQRPRTRGAPDSAPPGEGEW